MANLATCTQLSSLWIALGDHVPPVPCRYCTSQLLEGATYLTTKVRVPRGTLRPFTRPSVTIEANCPGTVIMTRSRRHRAGSYTGRRCWITAAWVSITHAHDAQPHAQSL
jgi:hypothetical protein